MQSVGLQSGGFRHVHFLKMAAIAVLVAASSAADWERGEGGGVEGFADL